MTRTLTLAGALLLALPAHAQSVDPERMESFASMLFDGMDLDGDGRLTEQEYTETDGGGFAVDYRLLDLDGDGAVSKSEYLVAVRKYHAPASAQPI